jgi:hypothetical protein
MAWRYTGKAKVNPRNPRAFVRSDRNGFWRNRTDMVFQYEWRGPRLVNTRLLVGRDEVDKPFIFNKPIVYPPDPVPIQNPRPEPFAEDNAGSPVVPLPWPVQQLGPPVPAPAPPQFFLPPPPSPPPIIFQLPPQNYAEE